MRWRLPRRSVTPQVPGDIDIISGDIADPLTTNRLVARAQLTALTGRSVSATAGKGAEPIPGQERIHGRWPEPKFRTPR
jgi:hypothetical protein